MHREEISSNEREKINKTKKGEKMKAISFLAAILITISLYAEPIINYVKINEWCLQAKKLESQEKELLASYFQLVLQLAQSCIKNHHWLHTPEGKKVQSDIDELINKIVENDQLKPVFQHFAFLVQEEIEQKENDYENRHTFYYTILELVVIGCLDCIQS